jgi:hypothetical protein
LEGKCYAKKKRKPTEWVSGSLGILKMGHGNSYLPNDVSWNESVWECFLSIKLQILKRERERERERER